MVLGFRISFRFEGFSFFYWLLYVAYRYLQKELSKLKAKEQSAEDRGRYESEENESRLRKRGSWVDDSPVPPWAWRQPHR